MTRELPAILHRAQGAMVLNISLPDFGHQWIAKHPNTVLSNKYHYCEKCGIEIYWDKYSGKWICIVAAKIPNCNAIVIDEALK